MFVAETELALLAVVAVEALPLKLPVTLPTKFPANAPLMTLLTFVAIVTPAKLFVPVNKFVPFSRGMFADSWESAMFPITLAAVVAVAALPARFAVTVPAEKFPLASRCTMVFTVFALVAALAALAPLATLASV